MHPVYKFSLAMAVFTIGFFTLYFIGGRIQSKRKAFFLSTALGFALFIPFLLSREADFGGTPIAWLGSLFGLLVLSIAAGGIFYLPLAGYKRISLAIFFIAVIGITAAWYFLVMNQDLYLDVL